MPVRCSGQDHGTLEQRKNIGFAFNRTLLAICQKSRKPSSKEMMHSLILLERVTGVIKIIIFRKNYLNNLSDSEDSPQLQCSKLTVKTSERRQSKCRLGKTRSQGHKIEEKYQVNLG